MACKSTLSSSSHLSCPEKVPVSSFMVLFNVLSMQNPPCLAANQHLLRQSLHKALWPVIGRRSAQPALLGLIHEITAFSQGFILTRLFEQFPWTKFFFSNTFIKAPFSDLSNADNATLKFTGEHSVGIKKQFFSIL